MSLNRDLADALERVRAASRLGGGILFDPEKF